MIEKPEEKKTPAKIRVTSNRDVEFLTLGWSINAGEERELPGDAEAQKVILANAHITTIK